MHQTSRMRLSTRFWPAVPMLDHQQWKEQALNTIRWIAARPVPDPSSLEVDTAERLCLDRCFR